METQSAASLALAGVALSGGLLVAVAGAGKLVRRMGDSAIRRTLGIAPRRWRPIELAAGSAELVTGIAVCTAVAPLPSGIVLTAMGLLFLGLLGVTRHAGTPGDCGCLGWGRGATTVTWRSFGRAAWVGATGVLGAVIGPTPADFGHVWFGLGLGTGLAVALVMSAPVRTPVCHRRLWFPRRDTWRLLAGHGVFEAVAESVGPLDSPFDYQRTGCVEEFRVPVVPDGTDSSRTAIFRVRRTAADGALEVRASVQATATGAMTQSARRLPHSG